MTEADARAELEPLFAALVRAHIAYCAIKSKDRTWQRGMSPRFRGLMTEITRLAEQNERYHAMHFGPMETRDA